MKRISLLLMGLISAIVLSGQPWTQELPANKSKEELTLFDYQKAFENYWEPFNLERGYYINEDGNKQKASGWKHFKRWEYYWEFGVDARTGKFPKVNPITVVKEWEQLRNSKAAKNADWQLVGPTSSSGGYAGVGRINTIAFHPTDTDTYWIGAPSGGVWKTTDNGATWTCLTDHNAVLGISDILIPDDYATSNTIYIATGDRDGWDNNSIGVLKSTDGGQTWNTTGLTFNIGSGDMVSRLLQHPTDPNTIIAATTDGVMKTTDGGVTWDDRLSYSYFIDLEHKPGDFDTFYGAKTNGQIYTTTDAGENWTRVLNSGGDRIELAVTPDDPTLVYALVSNNQGGLKGIYKSSNSGASYPMIYDGSVSGNNLLGWDNGGDDGGQGWYDLAIAASPTNADIVLIGGINTWKSTDGGNTWDMENHWTGSYGAQAVHADKHMLKYRENGDLFECNDGGVYISDSDGNSYSWTDKTNGMAISQIYRLGVAATNDDETIIGLQDNGTKLSYDGNWADVRGGDGMECIIDYTNENVQYNTVYYGAIRRTTNHWGFSSDVTPSGAQQGAWVTPYIIDPNDNETLYAGYANVWKTTNRGDSWTQISSMNSSNKLRSLAIAPSNSDVLYTADQYDIWKTSNGGSNWNNISAGLPYNSITYIAVKHNDPNTVWVTVNGYDDSNVYKSTNGGSSWTDISEGLPELPVTSIVEYTESSMEVLFVSTEVGIYVKKGDDPWASFNAGLPNVRVDEIEIYYDANPANNKLRAATYGRGLWESPIPDVYPIVFNVVDNDTGSPIADASITVSGEAQINTNTSGQASLNLFDGDYTYTVTADGYTSIENENLTITQGETINIALSQEVTYDITFQVTNQADGSTLENAEINIDGEGTYTTGGGGTATATLTPGDYTYDVNLLHFDPLTDQPLSVNGGDFVSIELTATNYTVSFSVANSSTGDNIENAEISIQGESTVVTNVDGEASTMLTVGDYNYSVTATDFEPISDQSFTVDGATNVDITMSAVGLTNMQPEDFEIYPNPANENLTIEVEGVYHLKLYNESGKIMKKLTVDKRASIDISQVPAGVYFVELSNENSKAVQKLIIK